MRTTLLLTSGLLAAASAAAAPLTPEQALERALDATPDRVAPANAAPRFKLINTRHADSAETVYLFSRTDAEGFVVVSADDAAPALLGYGSSKIGDESGNFPPEFSYWIDELGRQVAYAAAHPSAETVRLARPERESIAPLCTTRWNQSAPFNNQCPTTNDEHCVTGCVATAMAQVMKYHNWPETAKGYHEYYWHSRRLRINYNKTTFDWANMLDVYGDSDPEVNNDAVALLMMACGYSVDMNYSTTGSGAVSMNIAPALGEYFRYDKSLRYHYRDYYSLAQWEELIYNSLVNDGPVIYDGQSSAGGHSFVCDGYDRDGYFHFNWGWGGMSDGYFLLDALDPIHQGIGGAAGGFDYMQDCIVGIRPDTTGESTWAAGLISDSGIDMTYDITEDALTVNNLIYNPGPGTITSGIIGLRLTPLVGGEPQYSLGSIENVQVRYGYRDVDFDISSLADGEYMAEIVYCIGEPADDGSNLRPVPQPIFDIAEYRLTVTPEGKTLDVSSTEAPDFIDGIFPDVVDMNVPVTVSGTLSNAVDAPYLCFLSAILIKGDNVVAYTSPRVYDLDPSEQIPVDLTADWNVIQRLTTGQTYELAMAQLVLSSGRVALLNEPVEVTLSDNLGITIAPADSDDGIRVYYTPQGTRVATVSNGLTPDLAPGIYIVRSASKAERILIK